MAFEYNPVDTTKSFDLNSGGFKFDWGNPGGNTDIASMTPNQLFGDGGTNILNNTPEPGMFSMDSILGKQGPQGWQGGWGMPALQTGAMLTNAYMGIKNYGLAKDTLKEGQRQFDMNYNNQRQTMNTYMEDRQVNRVAAAGGATGPGYESVESYMARNRIA